MPLLPPIKVDCRNAIRWRDNNCYMAEAGTEYDWMQFLWNVNTVSQNKSSMAALERIYLEARNGRCSGPNLTWARMRRGAETSYGNRQDPKYRYLSYHRPPFVAAAAPSFVA